jgi:SpoIID/LytB domain
MKYFSTVKLLTLFLLCVFLLPAGKVFATTNVRVLIAEESSPISVKTSGAIFVKDLGSKKKYSVKKAGTFKISTTAKQVQAGSVKSTKGVQIYLKNKKDTFTVNGVEYKGNLLINPAAKTQIVEVLPLEEYLYGVLPYEMSYSWPIEALKAQAVAARTYTLKSIENTKNNPFDLYSDTRSQMYKGSAKVYDSVKKAVDETKNQVLKYNKNVFFTYYHANCGGHTDTPPWLTSAIKPLQGAKCGYCSHGAGATWKHTLSKETVNSFLKKNKIAGTIKSIKIASKTSSGRAKNLKITTTKTTKTIPCNTFRVGVGATKFKSCFITSINGLTFSGKGYGHGGGLCQEGAKGMAEAGKKYTDILKQYYPGAKLEKI